LSEALRPAADLEAALGYAFRDASLLEAALAHASWAHERDGSRGNERLEYLGDAVLDLAVAHLLCEAHPDWHEGELTRARAALVNKRALAARARALELGLFVRLGRTEQRSGGARKDSVLANALEAVLGAVYRDGGLGPALALTRRLFGAAIAEPPRRDAKTELQEWAHATFRRTPAYRTVSDSGTEDDEIRFTVEVRIGDRAWGRGVGRSKQSAERAAAREALARRAETDG
jgi:ribonuclease-3